MNKTPSTGRRALRTLLTVLAVVVVFVIFSYGWTVTDINLDEPQETQRQTNVLNALRELLSPNIFEQNYEVTTSIAPFQMGCEEAEGQAVVPAADAGTGASIIVTPACGERGDVVTIQGINFPATALGQIRWSPPSGESRPRPILDTGLQTFDVGDDGAFTARIEVPSIRGATDEAHEIEVDVRFPVGLPFLSNTTHQVLSRMVETIFLALIATVISIPPSVVLSFFAARNLMKPVRLSLGNLLVGVALGGGNREHIVPVSTLVAAVIGGAIALGQLQVARRRHEEQTNCSSWTTAILTGTYSATCATGPK